MFEKQVSKNIAAVYFIVLAVLSYYFVDKTLTATIGIAFRQIFVVLFILSGFVCWLIKPDIARTSILLRSSLVLCVPLAVMVLISLFLWVLQQTEIEIIANAFYTYFLYMNEILAVLVAVVFLLLFGERGLWYNLFAIIIANLLLIATIMAEHGVGAYLNELWILIKTFAGETGDIIREAEIHELAFCLGLYELYMILNFRKKLWFILLFIAATFCFVSAFKRIAMVAILVASILGLILKYLARRKGAATLSKVIMIMVAALGILAYAYIFAVKMGVFQQLEEQGVNVTGRADIYELFDKYYTFSPAYIGYGMGYVYYLLNSEISLYTSAIHNDFLGMYIDLGFWGFLIWFISGFALRVWYFGRNGKTENKAVVFAIMVYMFIVFSTDNTLTFQMVYSVTALIIMGQGFDKKTREEEKRLFGSAQRT